MELEESHITISTIKGSKYVEPIKSQVEDWERKIAHIGKVLEEWVNCQKHWLYLEQIFNTVDIQRQLSNDSRLFQEVDCEWRSFMQQIQEKPLVIKCCTKQGVLQMLQNCNSKLEKIQKSLEDYLETKRIIFPRLFFLSNDELLEILSKAEDPENVQRHLTKLFANVLKLKMETNSSQNQSITHLISYEGETFPLPRSIRVRGLAEQWLGTLEQGIFEAVKRQIKRCLIEMKQKQFIEWALNNFGQSILVSTQIQFSQNVTHALLNKADLNLDDTCKIPFIIEDIVKSLESLAVTISEDIENHKRLALEAMIVISVHHRDCAQLIMQQDLASELDFEWRKQIRYSWDELSSQCHITQVDSLFEYGNEYLGCSPRLVITPLTDRCYLTMTGALSFNLGGCSKGPAGTGKTETIKDLSKIMGRQCVVFNCSERLDNSIVAKLFSGIIQVGSWCCFDEFNRMNLEVLSVLAAQIYSIKAAKDAKMESFFFENKEIKLNPYCGIFITMNPSYTGRVELPDNLSFLFRPVAMMVPDYVLICEVILFSEGFITAKSLSSKITNLYRLCNDQLSNQQHYDFGLRSIKSVLVLTGHLRLESVLMLGNATLTPDKEMKILIQAIKIANLPRLINDDLSIFQSIMEDLFSSCDNNIENDKLLEKSIEIGYKELGFELWPAQIDKIKHLNSQLKSRHGVMLLGPSGSGKTVIRTVLQKALTLYHLVNLYDDLAEIDEEGLKRSPQLLPGRRAKIDVQVINPKAMTINHLYGYIDSNSFEWIEGIVPMATKKMIDISNNNQKIQNEQFVNDIMEIDSNHPVDNTENSISNLKGSETRVRRRSSLLSTNAVRRLSVVPRLSLESVDPIQEVVKLQYPKEIKTHLKKHQKDWQWIVLDGPIDSIWVENLNTVLDDSKILCMANGERINISPSLKFLFEVDNLKNSSPATVSRCAMIYVSHQSLDWRPQVRCWMKNKLPKSVPESGKLFIWKLFEISIDPGIKFLEKCNKLLIVPNGSCQSQLLTLMCILESFLKHISTHGGFGELENDKLFLNKNNEKDSEHFTGKISENKRPSSMQKDSLSKLYLQNNPKELNSILGKLFVFAFTWSFGAAFARQDDVDIETLDETTLVKKSYLSIYQAADEFDLFVKSIFDTHSETAVKLPLDNKNIYSYFFDLNKGIFLPWDSLVPSTKNLIDGTGILNFSGGNVSHNSNVTNDIIVSLDSIRYSFLSALLMVNHFPVILAGDSGIGKSTLVNDILKELCKKNGSSTTNPDSILGKVFAYSDQNQGLLASIQNLSQITDDDPETNVQEKHTYKAVEAEPYTYACIKFNSQTSISKAVQQMTSKMVKRGQDVIGPKKNKKMFLYIDDLNVPAIDEFGSQSTLEMVREWMELGGFYEYSSMVWTYVTDCSLIATCTSNHQSLMSERLTKHFCVLTLPQPSTSTLERIFQVKLGRYLYQLDFSAEIKSQLANIVSIPISVFFKVKSHYKISPQKSHYVFSLRSLHKVIGGILMADDKVMINKEEAGRFVAHEIIREFHDRLICDTDRDHFYKILSDDLHMFLRLNWSKDELKNQTIMYGKFYPLKNSSSSLKVYQSVNDKEKLAHLFENITNSYDNEHLNINHFIFFDQSIQHVVRILRILNQTSGHMLMIGVEGCGKYSNVKISTAIIGSEIFRLNMTTDYNSTCFRGDIKKIIQKSVLQNQLCTLYLSDVDDLATNAFMDDLCNLLNSGHIPDLYENDELENMVPNLKQEFQNIEFSNDPNEIYSLLIQKIKKYLHICIGLSPNNLQYRSRLRNYPSLINCCTIDWYTDWTTESLISVTRHRMEDLINNCNIELDDPQETLKNLTNGSIEIYRTAITIGYQFQNELRRSYFLSSGDFVEYLNVFANILQNNYNKNITNKQRLVTGLNQLTDTKALIAKMKEDLLNLTPKIQEKSEETDKLLKQMQEDKELTSEIEKIVKDEEDMIQLETKAVEKYSKECEQDLLSVIPILEASIKALDSLDKSSISEVRVYRNPPRLVEIVMNAVCVLMSVAPSWANAKHLLSDPNFVSKIRNYNKDGINKKMHRDLLNFTKQNDFQPEAVGRVSFACKSICQWVIAIEHYYTVNNMVTPKKKTVIDVQNALELSRQKLAWKQTQLKRVEDHVKNLDNKYQQSLEEQKQLNERVQITNDRLIRAAALIEAIQSEKDRWNNGITECEQSMKYIIGNCAISAAYITFTGPWTTLYREEAKIRWINILTDLSIPISGEYKFVEFEFSTFTVLNWYNDGLPRDKGIAENVAIIEKSQKWPLLIDPQKQGKRFLQSTFKKSFKVISCKHHDYIVALERAIRVGDIVCLEDIETSIDPVMGPLLRKEVYRTGNIMMIKLGDNELEYSPSFKLYLMSSLANPQLASSVNRLVTIVNFTVNMTGLQEQLLSLVVSKERPEIEKERNRFLRTYATDLEELRDLEDKTLGLLQDSTEKIVNDSELAQNLDKSKITALDIMKRLDETLQAEKQLQVARDFYLPLAMRGAQIYFVLADLAVVNYMYQYSLSWFQNLFIECVDCVNKELQSENVDSISFQELKLQKIIESITFNSYRLASHGLLSNHRPLFAFMLCTTIMRYSPEENENALSQQSWTTFIKLHTVSSVYGENIQVYDKMGEIIKQPEGIDWLTIDLWNKCKYLETQLENTFVGLCSSLSTNQKSWIRWNISENPFDMIESNFGCFSMKTLKKFDRIILISILCSRKLIHCVREYVNLILGERFSSFTDTNLMTLFSNTRAKVPILLILGPNSDPINNIMKLVTELRGNVSNLDIVSMGRGQSSKAESLIQKTNIHKGRWIFLQNCHLIISWMPHLQKLIENLQITKHDSDPNFKLILSTHPHKDFPIGILQNSLKIAVESPIGIKNQLLKSFALDGTGNVTEELFNNQSLEIRRMIFNLCLFNAAVLERRHFGSLGFSLPYDFNDSDLEISLKQLPNFSANSGKTVQWNALHNIIGNINYGGRITDNLDRRCLIHLLQSYESENNENIRIGIFLKENEDFYNHFENFDSINRFIRANDYDTGKSEILLGLGENAEIVRLENQSRSFIGDIIVQQSKHHEDKKTVDSNCSLDMLRVISKKIPRSVDGYIIDSVGKTFPKDADHSVLQFYKLEDAMKDDMIRFQKYMNYKSNSIEINRFFDSPFHNILEQEINQYNHLLNLIHKDIKFLIGYLLGEKNITENLEAVLDFISLNIVPPSWSLFSVEKSLSEWSFNICLRIDFIGYWCYRLLVEYQKYLDVINTTASEILADQAISTEKSNKLNVEFKALELIHHTNLLRNLNKSISCYWLPGFFSPQSFMTAIMQHEARQMDTSVDMFSIFITVLSKLELKDVQDYFSQSELYEITKPFPICDIISKTTFSPGHGVFVFGVYLDSALWDVENSCLSVNPAFKRYCKLPMLHLLPVLDKDGTQFGLKEKHDIFQCPLYRTPSRFGILSSSGKSSNFLCFLDLKNDKNPSFWILRGTAALLQCEID